MPRARSASPAHSLSMSHASRWLSRPDVGLRLIVALDDPSARLFASAIGAVRDGACIEQRYAVAEVGEPRLSFSAFVFPDRSALVFHPDGWDAVDLAPHAGSAQAWWNALSRSVSDDDLEPELTADMVGELALTASLLRAGAAIAPRAD